jgi:hypothetical protein
MPRFPACRLVAGLCLSGLLLAFDSASRITAQPADSEPALKVVKYDGLGEIVRQFRGKVVVVDFWMWE